MLADDVAICHPGNVITHSAMQSLASDAFAGLLANLLWMSEVKSEDLFQNPHGASIRLIHLLAEIQILIKILSHLQV